jgi:head-tail adaptor
MRQKVTIEKIVYSEPNSQGECFRSWEQVCSTWATIDAEILIRFNAEVKPKMRVIGNGRIYTISKVETVTDGGIKFSKLIYDTVRGDFARTHPGTKSAGLPREQDQRGKNAKGVKIL